MPPPQPTPDKLGDTNLNLGNVLKNLTTLDGVSCGEENIVTDVT